LKRWLEAKESAPARRSLFLAFAGVILLFVLSTSFSEFTARSINNSATAIAQNAAPSIQHLAASRAELRNLELTTDNYLDAVEDGSPGDAAAVRKAWSAVQIELEAYQRLPTFQGEREQWIVVNRDVRKLEGLLQELFAQVEQRRIAEARRIEQEGIRPLVREVLGGSLALIEVNSAQAARLAVSVKKARDRSAKLAFGLDAVSGLLAILVALLAVRDLRRSSALLEERNRLMAQRAEELEQFSGRVAHDVLSPLMVVALSLDLGERLPPDDPKRAESLRRGKTALGRVRSIVDGLLEFARAGAHPEPGAHTGLHEVADALLVEIQPAAEAKEITVVAAGDLRQQVACSPGVLASLLSNLVRNAIKYIGDGPERRVTLRAFDLGETVRLEVEDTGPGIPPGLERAIWEPYVRAKNTTGVPGIGLGLATVKRVAQAHGGAVGVRSRPGEGSLFWVELPKHGGPPLLAQRANEQPGERFPAHFN
jgi:signal transduction histidine kinase